MAAKKKGPYDKSFMHEIERNALMHALVEHGGSLADTARAMGVQYGTLQKKLQRLGLIKFAQELREKYKKTLKGMNDAEDATD
jgi:transcriptional regulator with GAF, ATPase, and Fis domain